MLGIQLAKRISTLAAKVNGLAQTMMDILNFSVNGEVGVGATYKKGYKASVGKA